MEQDTVLPGTQIALSSGKGRGLVAFEMVEFFFQTIFLVDLSTSGLAKIDWMQAGGEKPSRMPCAAGLTHF